MHSTLPDYRKEQIEARKAQHQFIGAEPNSEAQIAVAALDIPLMFKADFVELIQRLDDAGIPVKATPEFFESGPMVQFAGTSFLEIGEDYLLYSLPTSEPRNHAMDYATAVRALPIIEKFIVTAWETSRDLDKL